MKVIIVSIAILALVSWTATSASPAFRVSAEDHAKGNPRTAFMNYIDSAVKQFPKPKCGVGGEVEWNEYCNATTQTVHTCPLVTVGDRTDFFHQYCALDLTVRKLKALQYAPFRARASAISTVEYVFENSIPTEMCGTSPSSYCRRDTHVCDRSENPRGICVSPRMLCASDDHPEWCLASRAPIYVLKAGLMEFLNQTEWIERQLDSMEDLLDDKKTDAPAVSKQPLEEAVVHSSDLPGLVVNTCLFVSLALAILFVSYSIWRRHP